MTTRQARPSLPPGQRPTEAFPRFGAGSKSGLPRIPAELRLRVTGDVATPTEIRAEQLAALPRRRATSDLHCVTTWTKQGLEWSGWSLRDFYERLLAPLCRPQPEVRYLVCFGLDGFRATLQLDDALADGVLLADTLDGEPLSSMHGAPLRLVSPQQYAYKSVKHLSGFSLRCEPPRGLPLGLEHPRGRVALRERNARWPPWLVRLPYRVLVGPVVYAQRRGLTSSDMVGRPTLLDAAMPSYEVSAVYDAWVDAAPEDAYRALLAVTGREIRLLGPLTALRRLPARLAGRGIEADSGGPVIDVMLRGGFVHLAEEPGREIVLGAVGRFWKLAGDLRSASVTDGDSFAAFDRPGYAKAAMSFLVRREGRGSRVITETRVAGTDADASRKFRRYWRLIRGGSGAIRRSWLAALRRRLSRET